MPATAQESEEVKDLMLCPPYSGFQARDDKAKQQQFPQEYNDAMWTIDQAGTEKFKDEVLREKIRRSADGGWGDLSADNTRLHIGGDFGEFPDSPEWNLEGLAQQRPTPTLGHTRSMSSLENNAPLLSSTRPRPSGAVYGVSSRPTPSSSTSPPNNPLTAQDDDLLQSAANIIGVDEARIRKFAEEQARLARVHFSILPMGGPTIHKLSEEQARLYGAHLPDVPRNDSQLKFLEDQAGPHRAHPPELPRNDSPSKFAEEPTRLSQASYFSRYHTDALRNESRFEAAHTPTASADSVRLAAFAKQQLRQRQQNQSRSGWRLHQQNGILLAIF